MVINLILLTSDENKNLKMKKTINDFTPEIRSKIQKYKDRCVKDLYSGKEHQEWKREHTIQYVEYIYQLAKQPYKPLVVVAKNPLQYRYFWNVLFKSNRLKRKTEILFKLKNSLTSSELRSELSSELYSKLNSELDSKLDFELDSELNSELYSELDSKLDFELSSEIRSELDSELSSELYSKLNSELGSELGSELDSKLYSELGSELDSELTSELYSELNSELGSELKYVNHWLFLTSEYARVYLMWYKFIKDEFGLQTKKTNQLDWLYANVNLAHISKCYFTKGIVLVLQMPSKIMRNEVGFHSTSREAAIQFEGNYNINYINGRKISNWIFEKYFSGNLAFDDFNELKNEDERAGIITLIKENEGSEGVLKFLNAKLIDERKINHENGYSEIIKFYKTNEKYPFLQDSKGNMNVEYAWTEFTCPSTGQVYLLDSCPTITNSIEAAKFHRPNFVPHNVEYIWQSAN